MAFSPREWREKNREKVNGYAARWRQRNPEKSKEVVQRHRAKNPEKHRASAREWARRNKAKRRAYQYQFKYGITEADYEAWFEQVGGRCEICGEPEHHRRLSVDHCHSTKRVRGLLCSKCNKAVGLMQDDPRRLVSAAAYLRRAEAAILEDMLG